jgi:hypothetical protein
MSAPRIDRGATRGTVYREVAQLRMGDAGSLLANARYNGAIYMAGYAIECHLKFAFCQRKGELYLPAHLETHDWDKLVAASGLLPDIKQQPKMDAIYSALVDKWGPSLRYRTGKYSASEANRLYNELDELYSFLRELVP